MTNIMSFISNQKKSAVVIADGLGSNGYEKSDGHQKIFPIGKNYLLGTGASDLIQYAASESINKNNISPKELSDSVIETLNQGINLNKDEVIHFIITGKINDEIESYSIKYPRYKKPRRVNSFIADGSGAPFVNTAMTRDNKMGLIYNQMEPSVGDLSALLYNWAIAAIRSSGVNDQLQFGFITPFGNATLLHPNVRSISQLKEYKSEEDYKNNNQFYVNLATKLSEYNLLGRDAHQLTTSRIFNGIDSRKFSKEITKRVESLNKIRVDLDGMIESYVSHHN